MTIAEMIEVMQAYEDGKAIQYSNKGEGAWSDIENEPAWIWSVCDYRIKPQPKYVPWIGRKEKRNEQFERYF